MPFKRILSLALICAIVLTGATALGAPKVRAESISSLKDKLSDAQSKSAAIEDKIAALEDEQAPYEEQANAVKEQIESTQNEIDLYRAQITECEENIAEQQKSLDELQDKFKQRLVSLYKSSNYSSIQLLLTSDSMAEYLTKKEFLKCQSEKDSALIEQIITERNKLEEERVVLNSAKEKLDDKMSELDEQYEKYNAIISEFQDKIDMQQKELEEAEELEDQIRADIKEAEEAAAKAAAQSGNSGYNSFTPSSGAFGWPVPGYYSISSYYGHRWGRLHAGIDISSSGIYGSPIVASASGTVIVSSWYGGYGYCVMISHGNGYTTLYAHMAYSPSVSNGSYVSQGQVLGYIGSTGNSTGPHLHFEVRVNGSPQNPLNYL